MDGIDEFDLYETFLPFRPCYPQPHNIFFLPVGNVALEDCNRLREHRRLKHTAKYGSSLDTTKGQRKYRKSKQSKRLP